MGVEAVQERDAVEVVRLPTEKEPGEVGAVATFTVVVAVLVPFAFVAVSVYVIVEVGFTVKEPTSVEVENEPGEMATEEAFVIFQLRVEVPAEATMDEEAEKEEMEGGDPPTAGLKVAPTTMVGWFTLFTMSIVVLESVEFAI